MLTHLDVVTLMRSLWNILCWEEKKCDPMIFKNFTKDKNHSQIFSKIQQKNQHKLILKSHDENEAL